MTLNLCCASAVYYWAAISTGPFKANSTGCATKNLSITTINLPIISAATECIEQMHYSSILCNSRSMACRFGVALRLVLYWDPYSVQKLILKQVGLTVQDLQHMARWGGYAPLIAQKHEETGVSNRVESITSVGRHNEWVHGLLSLEAEEKYCVPFQLIGIGFISSNIARTGLLSGIEICHCMTFAIRQMFLIFNIGLCFLCICMQIWI